LRVCFSRGNSIYCAHDERAVTVIRVLHGSRDAAALAERGAFGGGG
jgi:plasmid stabilization system protein ParE